MSNKLLFSKKTDPNSKTFPITPTKANPSDAGYDLYSTDDYKLWAGQTICISTGIYMAIPEGYYGRIADRSSMAKNNLHIVGGVIDCSYRGEIKVLLHNTESLGVREISAGQKFAQIIITKICELEPAVIDFNDLPDSARGEKGFGSSGR